LQRCDEALLNSVDENALHISDVLHHAGHDVAGPAGIEPLERQALDFFVKIRADVEDDLLLEVVVDEDPQRIQPLFEEKSAQSSENPKAEFTVA
jgi:hypothetical protein